MTGAVDNGREKRRREAHQTTGRGPLRPEPPSDAFETIAAMIAGKSLPMPSLQGSMMPPMLPVHPNHETIAECSCILQIDASAAGCHLNLCSTQRPLPACTCGFLCTLQNKACMLLGVDCVYTDMVRMQRLTTTWQSISPSALCGNPAHVIHEQVQGRRLQGRALPHWQMLLEKEVKQGGANLPRNDSIQTIAAAAALLLPLWSLLVVCGNA